MPATARAAIKDSIDGAKPQKAVPEPADTHEQLVRPTLLKRNSYRTMTMQATSPLSFLKYPRDVLEKKKSENHEQNWTRYATCSPYRGVKQHTDSKYAVPMYDA